MRPEHFNDLAARQRFQREVQTLLLVNHPGVVTVYDSGELGDGTQYLIMERLLGLDLGSLIRRHGQGSPAHWDGPDGGIQAGDQPTATFSAP